MYKMINLFNWVTTLVESFTFYGGGKGGGSSSSTTTPVDFFGKDTRAPYEQMLGQLLGVYPIQYTGGSGNYSSSAGGGGAGGGVLPAGALEAIKSIFSGKGGGRGRVSGYAPGGGGSTVFDFIKSQPGYQFGMDQGQQRLDRQYAMTGVGPTGAENIALAGYGQQYAGDYYQKLVSNLMGASGSGQTGSSTSSQSTGASPIPGAIGTIAAALISDKNLKTNIKHIDTINGIKIYSFNYIWSYIKSIGVMAQDLLKMPQYKDAVHMTSIGYVVDYSKLPI